MPTVKGIGASMATALSFALLGACGVNAQNHPVALEVEPPTQKTTVSPREGDDAVTVYFVRHGRLVPVTRPAPDTSTVTALALLVAGPNGTEATGGLQTALVPQEVTAKTAGDREVTIAATRDFTSITGDNQLLAVAQLVWTVTHNAPSNRVRITVEGKAIEVPTDQGLTQDPVERDHYISVAPHSAPTPPPTPEPQTATPS